MYVPCNCDFHLKPEVAPSVVFRDLKISDFCPSLCVSVPLTSTWTGWRRLLAPQLSRMRSYPARAAPASTREPGSGGRLSLDGARHCRLWPVTCAAARSWNASPRFQHTLEPPDAPQSSSPSRRCALKSDFTAWPCTGPRRLGPTGCMGHKACFGGLAS